MRRGLLISAAAALVMCTAQAASASPGWVIQPTPSPSGSSGLGAVACTSASNCIAVGDSGTGVTFDQPLAEHWDGSTWTTQSMSTPAGTQELELNGVSCSSPTSCTAVGWYAPATGPLRTLAEHWDGSTWTIQPTPTRAGTQTELTGVSCSSASTCVGVGTIGQSENAKALAERWNGSTWFTQAVASPAGATATSLAGVSCTSGGSCTAVGQYSAAGPSQMLAERWGGGDWTVQSTPGVANGQSWLSGISCRRATSCVATGGYDTTGRELALTEQWAGGTWIQQTVPNPTGAIASSLTSISCALATNCTAVGSYETGTKLIKLLAEQWNGSQWVVLSPRNPSGSVFYRSFGGVWCTAATHCTAVGEYSVTRQGSYRTLAEVN